MTKNYHLVGAFDRHNYGDILFPLVHTENLLANGVRADQIKYYAITASDLTKDGGYVTESVKTLLSKNLTDDDAVILCGGDILSADWMLMVAHLRSTEFLKIARVARRLLGVTLTNDIARALLGEVNAFPYVISKSDCSARVYFTAVGGAGFKAEKHLGRVAQELLKTDGVSVRDREIQTLLSQNGVDAALVPDTALIMSDFFTPDILAARDWKSQLKVSGNFDFGAYYSFQGAKRLLENHVDDLVREISKVYELSGLSPMFVRIGRAPDHEDHVVLEEIYQRTIALNIPCAYQDSEHILDIMTSLAFARSYVGTSLHGAITTYSFGKKPNALFCNEVKKLKDFLNTWLQPSDYALHPTASFASRLNELIRDEYTISAVNALRDQKGAVKTELAKYI